VLKTPQTRPGAKGRRAPTIQPRVSGKRSDYLRAKIGKKRLVSFVRRNAVGISLDGWVGRRTLLFALSCRISLCSVAPMAANLTGPGGGVIAAFGKQPFCSRAGALTPIPINRCHRHDRRRREPGLLGKSGPSWGCRDCLTGKLAPGKQLFKDQGDAAGRCFYRRRMRRFIGSGPQNQPDDVSHCPRRANSLRF